MTGAILLHPACHPKEVSRKISLETHHKTFCSKFKELFNIGKRMTTCHNEDKLKRLVMPRLLKPCDGDGNKAAFHAECIKINMMENRTSKKRKPLKS